MEEAGRLAPRGLTPLSQLSYCTCLQNALWKLAVFTDKNNSNTDICILISVNVLLICEDDIYLLISVFKLQISVVQLLNYRYQ